MSDVEQQHGLRRGSVSLPGVLFQSITFMAPGIGIAFAIGIGVPLAGTALPLSLLVALVACTFAAIAIGQLAIRMPSAGGLFTYVSRGIGARAGFTVGWYFVAFAVLLPPFFALQEGWFVDQFLVSRGLPSPGAAVFVAAYLVILFALTYFDVRLSVRTAMILGSIEMAVFLLLGITLVLTGTNSTAPFLLSSSPNGLSGVAQAAVFAVLAFIGFEAAAAFGEEARNPRRAVPWAVVGSSVGVGVFYLFLTYAWNAGTGLDIVGFHTSAAGNDWPQLAQSNWGDLGSWVVFLALLNSIVAAGASATNSCARVLYSMGQQGTLPHRLGRVHSRHRTPHVAIIVSLAASALVSLAAGLKFGAASGYAVVGTTFTILAIIVYMLVCVACVIYFSGQSRAERRIGLHVIVPVLGVVVFVLPLYAQAFDLNSLFQNGRLFVVAVVDPFQWAVWGAVVWIVIGLVLMATRRFPDSSNLNGHAQADRSD